MAEAGQQQPQPPQAGRDISSPNANAEIRYTLDGTEPTDSSALYAGPITLTSSAMLQARTFDTLPEPEAPEPEPGM